MIIDAKKQEPGYFAFIPASVLYDKNVPANAKLLYGTIASLCNKTGYCWAGNAYLARLYDTSERTVANLINALRNAGHISVDYSYTPGKKEIESRFITLTCIRESPGDISPAPQTPRPDTGPDGDTEGVKKSSPGDEKIFTTSGKNLHEVVKKSSEGGEKIFRDININNINNNITATTAAAGPPNAAGQPLSGDPPGADADPPAAGVPEAAAAAPVSPPELKAAFAALDRGLVFDKDFYPKAAGFMAANGLDSSYLPWLFEQCELKNPRSLDGLYYRLFFAENMVEKFKALRHFASPRSPPPPLVCPVCGVTYDRREAACPSCGLDTHAPPDEIRLSRELYAFPRERRDEFHRRNNANAAECGADFIKYKSLSDNLKKEFGLT